MASVSLAFQRATGGKSVWTADVAQWLRQHGVQGVLMYTAYLGVRWAELPYYSPSFRADEVRVAALLRTLGDAGVAVERTVTIDQLAAWVRTHYVIVLVDKGTLEEASSPSSTSSISMLGALLKRRGYVGHYVLLAGVAADGSHFVFTDPARPSGEGRRISASDLDRARSVDGTDQDLIFIPRPG